MKFLAVMMMMAGILSMSGGIITQRWILKDGKMTKKEVLLLQHGGAAILLALALGGEFIFKNSAAPIAAHSLFWIAVAGTTIANVFIQYANTRACEIADVSLTAPISALTPGLITIAALTLREFPSEQGVLGIALISLGTFIHSRENAASLKDYLKPFSFLFLPANFSALSADRQKELQNNRLGLRWAYGSALVGTLGLLFDGLVARNGNVMIGFGIQQVFLMTSFSFLPSVKNPNNFSAKARKSIVLKYGALLGFFYGLHIIFIMTSFRLAPVAYIGSLKRMSIIVIVLLSRLILKEKRQLAAFGPQL